ncbi:hypothetical protein SASPL_109151 [Salvia splendens]|uniref:RNA helicase n=1 Tax=Salvia splendens TaxID=180675 RepID=A0A8X8YED3_SALSN|nr:hypothetical protein SASPL_109151 [Salvia splendens]
MAYLNSADPLQGFSLQLVMGTINDKSDDVYSYVGDKGDIGFIDFDNCQSVCSYNPAEESDTFNISVPFHLIEGRKPQSGIVGETMSDSGYIYRVEAENILLKFDQQFYRSHRDGHLYNVEFNYNRTNMRRLYQAVEVAQSLERNFLFPSAMSKVRLRKYKALTPICSDLNEEQTVAVNTILVRRGGPPYVIHGHPGTGKTKTRIEAMLQIYREDRHARILACAPSNSAADHILDRLINEEEIQIREHEIFQLNAYTRPFEDVNPNYISIQRGRFSYIFLDEAGQASEPEAMVPISHLYSRNTVLVLRKHPMQLGPVVFSTEAEVHGLGTSYLERLFECDLYRGGDTNKNSPTSWEGIIPDKEFPLLFIGIRGCDEREGSNPSWFNRIEASKTVEMIKVLIEEKGLKEEEIGVIAPYRKQVSKIREALECLGNPNVKVGSVEQFQGQEREVIIISTVRSTVKHNEFDKVHYLGFLSNPRRFNVAVTRAKSLIIIIGNPHIICKLSCLNMLGSKLEQALVENNSYKGCFLPKQEEESEQAKGEYQSYYGGNNQPSGSNWDDQGGGWQPSQGQWGEDVGWSPSDVPLGEEENNNIQPSDVPWGEEENNNVQPSDVPRVNETNIQSSNVPSWGNKDDFDITDGPREQSSLNESKGRRASPIEAAVGCKVHARCERRDHGGCARSGDLGRGGEHECGCNEC